MSFARASELRGARRLALVVALVLPGATRAAPSPATSTVAPAASATSPAPAAAKGEAQPVAEVPGEDPTSRARTLYAEGQLLFDLADYEGALERWTAAYLLLTKPQQRLKLLYTIAETHLRAHEVTGDAAHLRRARALFAQFLAGVQTLSEGRASLSSDVALASVRIEKIDRTLAEREREAAEQRELLRTIAAGTLRIEPSRPVRTMRATGAALTAAGSLALVGMIVGLVLGARASEEVGLASLPEDQRALLLHRGPRFNAMAIAGGALAGAALAAGVPLLVIAARRARAEREHAVQQLRPALAPGALGVVWEGRF